jgi:putative oxidoreductase
MTRSPSPRSWPPAFLVHGLDLLEAAARALQPLFLLAVRLYWGWQFAQTGWGKLHNLPKVAAFFASLGIPLPGLNAPFVAALEWAGGILLALGLATRPIGLLLVVDMVVAYATAHREALGAILRDPGTFYGATPFTFLAASLVALLYGAGPLSLDALLAWRAVRRR